MNQDQAFSLTDCILQNDRLDKLMEESSVLFKITGAQKVITTYFYDTVVWLKDCSYVKL